MSEIDLDGRAFLASDPEDLYYWKQQIDGRWADFLTEFDRHVGKLMESKPAVDLERGVHRLGTIVGDVTFKLIYGVEEKHLGGWVVFFDEPQVANIPALKELFWVHLSDKGWTNLKGEPLSDRFGRASASAVLKALVAAKLSFNTDQIQQAVR